MRINGLYQNLYSRPVNAAADTRKVSSTDINYAQPPQLVIRTVQSITQLTSNQTRTIDFYA